jgi:hypothetical protein
VIEINASEEQTVSVDNGSTARAPRELPAGVADVTSTTATAAWDIDTECRRTT